MKFDYIKCHGSGNEFVMVDAVKYNLDGIDLAAFARFVCNRENSVGADGVLLLVKEGEMFGMRMFNPDGSEAEMCGNGIRCVARLAEEYVGIREFEMFSGKNTYGIVRAEDIFPTMPTYGVDLKVRLMSEDFGFAKGAESFISQPIERLDSHLLWTAINVGNPHIVAAGEDIDMEELVRLGEKVTSEKRDFPRGINVSLYKKCGDNAIYVATYERGAGITYSCGTAMTASSTAAVLLGLCDENHEISVYNRGGMVKCCCRKDNGRIVTRLTGNATYRWCGIAEWQSGEVKSIARTESFDAECTAYDNFMAELKHR